MAFPANGITFSNPNGIYLSALQEGMAGLPMLSQPQGIDAFARANAIPGGIPAVQGLNLPGMQASSLGGSNVLGANSQVQNLLASLTGQASNPLATLAATQMGLNLSQVAAPMSQQLGLQGGGVQSFGAYSLGGLPAATPSLSPVVSNYNTLATLQTSLPGNVATTGMPPAPVPSGGRFGFTGTGFSVGNTAAQSFGKGQQSNVNSGRYERTPNQTAGHGGRGSGSGGGGNGGFGKGKGGPRRPGGRGFDHHGNQGTVRGRGAGPRDGSPGVRHSDEGYSAEGGQWECYCGFFNKPQRNRCWACAGFRPRQDTGPTLKDIGEDWDCPKCGSHNFAMRATCKKPGCECPKPPPETLLEAEVPVASDIPTPADTPEVPPAPEVPPTAEVSAAAEEIPAEVETPAAADVPVPAEVPTVADLPEAAAPAIPASSEPPPSADEPIPTTPHEEAAENKAQAEPSAEEPPTAGPQEDGTEQPAAPEPQNTAATPTEPSEAPAAPEAEPAAEA